MLATEVVWASKTRSMRRSELLARSFAYTAKAVRLRGDTEAAGNLIETARVIVRKAGVTDSFTLAEIDRIEGAFHHMLRSLSRAEVLQRRAVLLYSLAGAGQSAAKMLIALGYLHSDAGKEERAVEITQTAITLLEEHDIRSLLYARHNLTWSLLNLERHEEAETLFEESQELYTAFSDPWTQCRRQWIRARIDAGLGRREEAEARFLQTFEKLHTSGYPYDAILLVLDLVDLYLQEGKLRAVAEIAEALSVLFEEKGLHQEAVSALRLFQERARQEAVTQALRKRLSRYLIEARHRPELRFQG
jgi:tetratricopeptide (TPR) repeat protein